MKKILVIDVGGTRVKVLASQAREPRKFDTGPKLTGAAMAKEVKRITPDWAYDAVSIGYPGLVVHGKIAAEAVHLAAGWVGFDFGKAFGCPVRIINDAALQALGNYRGGRLLFLGLGTGLGSAMIVDGQIEPMELAHLPYKKGRTYEDYVGIKGLKRLGEKKWRRHVWAVVELLRAALEPDTVVVGGGNAARLDKPPKGVTLGDNAAAFTGGFRLWQKTKNPPEPRL